MVRLRSYLLKLPLVDKAKISSRGRGTEITIQRRKTFVRTRLFLDFFNGFFDE